MASLTQRQGTLGKRLAAHLLRRATYHVTPARIYDFANKTADQAVDELFNVPALQEPKGPINFEDMTSYWLTDDPYTTRPLDTGRANRAVLFWFYNELMMDTSIKHKMAIFYSGIFVTDNDADWRKFDYFRLLQFYAVGSIKDLALKMTLDNKMLRYLNGNVNNKWSPNENYAREFFELFTILKGEQVGEGNYTNYTEHDIQEAARVLTGFKNGSQGDAPDAVTGLKTSNPNYNHHDVGNKQFSGAFNHKIIIGAVDEADMYRELQEFVDMIFDKVETARSYVRRLYHFFVSDIINDEIESDVIEPLALQLWTDNYQVENTLKKLLKSVHFYDEDDSDNTNEIIGGKIKSPLELYFSSLSLFDAINWNGINSDAMNYLDFAGRMIFNVLELAGYPEYPISVEGYPGYFKSPSYSRNWIDSSTFPTRAFLGTALIEGSSLRSIYNDLPFQVDMVKWVENTFSNPDYALQTLDQIYELVFPEMPDDTRKGYFRNKLTGGLTVINWMFDWQNYLASGDDSSVRVTLEDLLEAICGSPEFQTF